MDIAGIEVLFTGDAAEQLAMGPGGSIGSGGTVAAPNITQSVIAHPQTPPKLTP